MPSIHCIGDLHYKIDQYYQIIDKYPYTVCLGDIGFNYDFLKKVDPTTHLCFAGNHDNIQLALTYPHFLGHFGLYQLNEISFFYIRGAFSIDKIWRNCYIDWFPDEQLNYTQAMDCIQLYKEIKPNIVLSHDAPSSVINELFNPTVKFESFTQKLLDELFNIHQPKKWLFGHWHRSCNKIINGTHFTCLNELEVKELSL